MTDPQRTQTTLRDYPTANHYIASHPTFRRNRVREVHNAVYRAAICMTDDEMQEVVTDAMLRARRALSS